MKRLSNIHLLSILIITLLISLACTLPTLFGSDIPDSAPETGFSRIDSPDGSAVLEIPANALPDGVDLDDITIASDPAAKIPFGDGSEWVYELAPDGLEFSQPVKLTVSLPMDEELLTIGAMQISGEDEPEPLDIHQVEVDDYGTVRVSAELTHFSKAVFLKSNTFFEITNFEFPDAPVIVGDPFTIKLGLMRKGRMVDFHRKGGGTVRFEMIDMGWDLLGDWFAGSSFNPQEKLSDNHVALDVDQYEISTTWTCVRPSDTSGGKSVPENVYYKGNVKYSFRMVWLDKNLDEEDSSHWANQSLIIVARAAPIVCLADQQVDVEVPHETITAEVPEVKETPIEEEQPGEDSEPRILQDPADDPICCQACQPIQDKLPKNIDIDQVEYQRLANWGENKICVHHIVIRTHQPLGDPSGRAAISFDDPLYPQAVGNAPLCLEAGVNRTYGVILVGDTASYYVEGMSPNEDGTTYSWKPIQDTFEFEVKGNEIHFYIPCEQVSSNSTWMAWTYNVAYCDEVGYR